ncbi:hypothetical protein PENANT_c014G02284 [Penicillium antarcticum]|uniref:BTB domain-containing protein n=1 Tax=Penicillium antarcticum TaxID=416450 RepID=A0A1V6Q4G8_9EURO|nr:hypothetical protein PENANT_c014G02284 [Penicillium antarcticum]
MEINALSVEGTDLLVHRLQDSLIPPQEIHLTGRFALEMMDDNPRIIEAMLRSFYGLSYDGINKATNEMCPMLFNVMVYNIASKYQAEYLKVQA